MAGVIKLHLWRKVTKMADMFYYENKNHSSPFAVNYKPAARLWFVSHGFKLNYVTSSDIIKLGLIPILENNEVITE